MDIDHLPWFGWYPNSCSAFLRALTASVNESKYPNPMLATHLPVRLSLWIPRYPDLLFMDTLRFLAFSDLDTLRRLQSRLSQRRPFRWSINSGDSPYTIVQITRWANCIFPLRLPHRYPRFIKVVIAGFPAQRRFHDFWYASADTAPSLKLDMGRCFHNKIPVSGSYERMLLRYT